MDKPQQLKKELLDFITKLHELGKEDLLCLVSLTQVVQPELDFNWRLPLLSHIFSEIPNFLEQGVDLNVLIAAPPPELPHLRLLIDMLKIPPVLNALSYNALLVLTSTIPSSGSAAEVQYQMLVKLQTVFQSWSHGNVKMYCETMAKIPPHLEREKLLELDATVPLDIVPIVVRLLKSNVGELEALKFWMENLKEIDLIVMANLFQFEPPVLTKLKKHFSPPSGQGGMANGYVPAPLNAQTVNNGYPSPNSLNGHIAPVNGNHTSINGYQISLNEQPASPSSNGQPTSNVNLQQPVSVKSQPIIVNDYPIIVKEPPVLSPESNEKVSTPRSLKRSRQNPEVSDIEAPMKSLVMNKPSLEVELFGDDHANANGVTYVGSTKPADIVPPSPRKKSSPSVPSTQPIKIHTISQYKPPTATPPASLTPEQTNVQMASAAYQNQWVLKVLDKGQPPSQTVYQRILKPAPAVILLPPVQDSSQDLGFFVEASLIRSDNSSDLPSTLEGTKIIRIEPGKMAAFKKLKILSTTQQIGSLVRIKFQLKKANEGTFITIHGVHTISNPIEVFSHTYYLNRVSLPIPPVVTEILPSRGPACGGTRVAILGDNFIDSPNLRLRFGNIILQPIFHESRTLICITPYGIPQSVVLVSVSNDGVEYSAAQAQFAYD